MMTVVVSALGILLVYTVFKNEVRIQTREDQFQDAFDYVRDLYHQGMPYYKVEEICLNMVGRHPEYYDGVRQALRHLQEIEGYYNEGRN